MKEPRADCFRPCCAFPNHFLSFSGRKASYFCDVSGGIPRGLGAQAGDPNCWIIRSKSRCMKTGEMLPFSLHLKPWPDIPQLLWKAKCIVPSKTGFEAEFYHTDWAPVLLLKAATKSIKTSALLTIGVHFLVRSCTYFDEVLIFLSKVQYQAQEEGLDRRDAKREQKWRREGGGGRQKAWQKTGRWAGNTLSGRE